MEQVIGCLDLEEKLKLDDLGLEDRMELRLVLLIHDMFLLRCLCYDVVCGFFLLLLPP